MSEFVFRYFWIVSASVVLLSLLLGRHRAGKLVAAGRITPKELSGFVRGALLLVGGSFALLGLLQRTSREPSPLCLLMFPTRTLPGLAFWVAQLLLSIGIVVWIWRGGGASLLSRIAPAFLPGSLDRQVPARTVGRVLTVLLLAGPAGNILADRLSDASSQCPAISRTAATEHGTQQ